MTDRSHTAAGLVSTDCLAWTNSTGQLPRLSQLGISPRPTEEGADPKTMLDQLATHVGEREGQVLGVLRFGYWQAEAGRIWGYSPPTAHRSATHICHPAGYTTPYAPTGSSSVWLIGKPEGHMPYAEANELEDIVKELKDNRQRYLVWARPGEKPGPIEVGKAEQLACPNCGATLKPKATRVAKLSDDFHDVFRCAACKHIFSPLGALRKRP